MKFSKFFYMAAAAAVALMFAACEQKGGDEGEPVAIHEDTMTGVAFRQLAEAVVRETERRNSELPPTHIVEMQK